MLKEIVLGASLAAVSFTAFAEEICDDSEFWVDVTNYSPYAITMNDPEALFPEVTILNGGTHGACFSKHGGEVVIRKQWQEVAHFRYPREPSKRFNRIFCEGFINFKCNPPNTNVVNDDPYDPYDPYRPHHGDED